MDVLTDLPSELLRVFSCESIGSIKDSSLVEIKIPKAELYQHTFEELIEIVKDAAKGSKVNYILLDPYTLAKAAKMIIMVYIEKGGVEV